MVSPNQKAKELIHTFMPIPINDDNDERDRDIAKQSAIKCVKEIIEANPINYSPINYYWELVIDEIQSNP